MNEQDSKTLSNGLTLINQQIKGLDTDIDQQRNMLSMLTEMREALLSSASVIEARLSEVGYPAQLELQLED